MKMTVQPTQEFVEIEDLQLPMNTCRVWRGHTDDDTPVIAFVTMIACPQDSPDQDGLLEHVITGREENDCLAEVAHIHMPEGITHE